MRTKVITLELMSTSQGAQKLQSQVERRKPGSTSPDFFYILPSTLNVQANELSCLNVTLMQEHRVPRAYSCHLDIVI